jgi:hypothetical protein
MQPLLTSVPTVAGSLVPWMPMSPGPPLKVSWTSEKPDRPKA